MKNIYGCPKKNASCVPDLADISDARTDYYILSPHTFAANFGLKGLISRSMRGLNFARHLRRLAMRISEDGLLYSGFSGLECSKTSVNGQNTTVCQDQLILAHRGVLGRVGNREIGSREIENFVFPGLFFGAGCCRCCLAACDFYGLFEAFVLHFVVAGADECGAVIVCVCYTLGLGG